MSPRRVKSAICRPYVGARTNFIFLFLPLLMYMGYLAIVPSHMSEVCVYTTDSKRNIMLRAPDNKLNNSLASDTERDDMVRAPYQKLNDYVATGNKSIAVVEKPTREQSARLAGLTRSEHIESLPDRQTDTNANRSHNVSELIVKDVSVSNDSVTSGNERCLRTLTIYTPRMSSFKSWREYEILIASFKEAARKKMEHVFIGCPDQPCDIALQAPTADEQILNRSDAVLINMNPEPVKGRMHDISTRLMQTLKPNVKIVLYAMESPLMMNMWDKTFQGIGFHYTWTYHPGSDVYFPYGFYALGEPTDMASINYAENKTGLLVWAASNCNDTFWPRRKWVHNLERLVRIDIYGRCGNLTCLPAMSPECTKRLSVHKFYLALENAECDDYITEKFWDSSLLNGIVPIVYGGRREAYERLAPPNSFIHVSDFGSQKELVDYLNMVDNNDTLYNEFFKWRTLGRVEKNYPNLQPSSFCKVLPIVSRKSPGYEHKVENSPYFKSCRGERYLRKFRGDIDLETWKPWV